MNPNQAENQPAMNRGYLYLCISVSGASVLAIEILGTRILGPFYGVSLFLWSALITVTLAALSIGYAVGGALADRGARISRLSALLALAGAWLLLVPWIKHPVLWIAEPLGLRFAVLLASLILFFPPLMLLGMVSPYAIKLNTGSLSEVGRSAGNLYAMSTAASVLAALLTGFFLVPFIGVARLTSAVGIILIVTASLGLWGRSRSKSWVMITAVILITGAVALTLAGENSHKDKSIVAQKQSPYGKIRVVDKEGKRFLLIDGSVHTIVDPETWETYFPYVNVIDIAKMFFEKPGKLLLIGLGGGSVVKHFASDGWDIEAVEIDPVVIDFAFEYFGLDSTEARIFNMDGRRFVLTSRKNYDLIVIDAFGSSSIPFHLVTKEAFSLVADKLGPQGVLAMNVESIGWDDLIVRSLAATLKGSFKNVIALPIAEPPNKLGNVVILASDRELALAGELPPPEWRFSARYDRAHAWDNRFEPSTKGAPIITDDLNPVDLWAERINLVARKGLHKYFGRDFVTR